MSAESATEREQRSLRLQERICAANVPLPEVPKDLFRQLRACLHVASDEEKLKSSSHLILKLLKLTTSVDKHSNTHVITGGELEKVKDFRRTLTGNELFERDDGALIGFALTLRAEPKQPLELLAYDFEIRFPEGGAPSFLRFDLNLPGHENDDKGMRSHFHPGNDDLQAHAPLMGPVELLEFLIYGLRPRNPDKPRAS